MQTPKIEWAQQKAEETIQKLSVTTVEQLLDLESLCRDRGVAVRAETLKNFEGVLLRKERLILVSPVDFKSRKATFHHRP